MEITVEGWGGGVHMAGDLRWQRHRYSLDELLAGMTPEREHVQEDDGSVGVEWLPTPCSDGRQGG